MTGRNPLGENGSKPRGLIDRERWDDRQRQIDESLREICRLMCGHLPKADGGEVLKTHVSEATRSIKEYLSESESLIALACSPRSPEERPKALAVRTAVEEFATSDPDELGEDGQFESLVRLRDALLAYYHETNLLRAAAFWRRA